MVDFLLEIDKLKEQVRVDKYQERELISESKHLLVKEGEYLLRNGQVITRELVSKKLGSGDAVAIFAVTSDKEVILVVQSRPALANEEKVDIEIPAGYIEVGETVSEAGRRELEEETGYTTSCLIEVDEYYPSIGFGGEKIHLVLALDCTLKGEQHLDESEYILVKLVSLEEFEVLLNVRYIQDVNSRMGYYRYLEYLMKEGS